MQMRFRPSRRGQYVPNLPELRTEAGEVAEHGAPVQTFGTIVKPFHLVSGATNNATLVIGATAWVLAMWMTNINAAMRFRGWPPTPVEPSGSRLSSPGWRRA